MSSLHEILDEALHLPRSARGYLAERLLESLDADAVSGREQAILDWRYRNDEPVPLEQFKQIVRAGV